jgi:hypothetical protein
VGASISRKWDGAPAFVFGAHPVTKKFFLGTKGVFSGKLAFNESDIPEITESPELREKLTHLFRALRPHVDANSKVFQGDLLWWPGMKELDFVKNVWYIQPNTLRYEIDGSGDLRELMQSKVGVAIHTQYTGGSIENLQAEILHESFNYTSEGLSIIYPGMHQINFPMPGPKTAMDIQNLRTQYSGYSSETLKELTSGRLHTLVKQFVNHAYRKQITIDGSNFTAYIFDEYDKEAKRLKTFKGMMRKKTDGIKLVASLSVVQLDEIFKGYKRIVLLKDRMIQFLNATYHQGVQVYLPDGTPCGPEGYVYQQDRDYFKMVIRSVFSRANMLNDAKRWVGK